MYTCTVLDSPQHEEHVCMYMCSVLGSPQHMGAPGACMHVLCLARPDPTGRTSSSTYSRDFPLDKSLDTAGQGWVC